MATSSSSSNVPRGLQTPPYPLSPPSTADVTDDNDECENPCKHHWNTKKYGYAREHTSLQKFVKNLSKGLTGVFPRVDSFYKKVHVLLISWKHNDLNTAADIRILKALFEAEFGYTMVSFEIPSKNSQVELEAELLITRRDLAREATNPKLLIVYYGGHGNLDDRGRSEWQAWNDRPKEETVAEPPKVDWTRAATQLEESDGDVLFILDCCYATSMARGRFSGIKELLAASDKRTKAGGFQPNAFTLAVIKELREIKQRRYSAALLHERLIKNQRLHNLETAPMHVFLSDKANPTSIALAPLFPTTSVCSQASSILSASRMVSDCRVLISVSLENKEIEPIMEEWYDWIAKNSPQNIGGVELKEFFNVEARYESNSTLLLATLPVSLWDLLPASESYSFVGIVRSRNLEENPPPPPVTPSGSQAGSPVRRRSRRFFSQPTTSDALPSFVSPLGLLWNDTKLFFKIWTMIPGIVLPLRPCLSGKLDELSLTGGNLRVITFHGVLIILQLIFLASLPLCFVLPMTTFLFYFIGFLVLNYILCIPTNGQTGLIFQASPKPGIPVAGKGEKWIFINGVSVGHHWLQNNIQRLANTFRRQIIAVHNPTYGIIFDLIQCLIERDFSYNTNDVRQAYELVKKELMKSSNSKVVLIVHSQGAIKGGMVIDWLLADLPEHKLSKLEVYTFGNAANHFNNPVRRSADNGDELEDYDRVIPHIEHYANSGDFVARFGVLNYAKKEGHQKENRFVGQVFEREGRGHMLCQHYLDTMFVMEGDRVADHNSFMDSYAKVDTHNSGTEYLRKTHNQPINSISRLWKYRNGGL